MAKKKTAKKFVEKSTKNLSKKLINKSNSSKQSAAKQPTIKMIARTKSESVEKHTGKNWDQWIAILKKAGADFWDYKEIVKYLKTKHHVSIWWQQIVANGFQVHTGIRKVGENSKGLYSLTIARNLDKPIEHVWKKFASSEGIQHWLNPMGNFSLQVGTQFEIADGIYGELRTMMSGLRVRMKWVNEEWSKHTFVQFYLNAYKPEKCMIIISHGDLANAKIKEEMKQFWLERLNQFIAFL